MLGTWLVRSWGVRSNFSAIIDTKRVACVLLFGGRKQMSVPIYCPEMGCGEFCGEVGWSGRFSSFDCPSCGTEFEANGMGDINMGGDM